MNKSRQMITAAVIRQLRKGGYVVAKAAPVTMSDDAMLAALES